MWRSSGLGQRSAGWVARACPVRLWRPPWQSGTTLFTLKVRSSRRTGLHGSAGNFGTWRRKPRKAAHEHARHQMISESDELTPILNGLASYFAGKPGVQAAWLFGSHCEGRSHRDSDVDVAVLLEHGRYPDARARFEARVAMTADLIARSCIETRSTSSCSTTHKPCSPAASFSTAGACTARTQRPSMRFAETCNCARRTSPRFLTACAGSRWRRFRGDLARRAAGGACPTRVRTGELRTWAIVRT